MKKTLKTWKELDPEYGKYMQLLFKVSFAMVGSILLGLGLGLLLYKFFIPTPVIILSCIVSGLGLGFYLVYLLLIKFF